MINDYPTLQLNSQGNNVKILQQLLKILNLYPMSITGSFDTSTENAVIKFQEDNNLNQTGIVNKETWSLLLEQTSKETPQSLNPILQFGSEGDEVSSLQQQLKTTLYYNDSIDGYYGTSTENAVKEFQLNNKIIATGITNDSTWFSLEQAYSPLTNCTIIDNPTEDTEEYTIKKGDTLYSIAKKFNTTVEKLKQLNNLTSNTLTIGNIIVIPKQDYSSTYTVKKGDTLYSIAQAFNISLEDLKKANNLTSNVLSIGQILTIPKNEENYITYTVKKGDTLYSIARNYNVSVNTLMKLNNLSTSILTIGQTIIIPTNNENNYITYYVKKNDTLYSIANTYNTTVDNIKKLNNLTSNTLQIGQKLLISQ